MNEENYSKDQFSTTNNKLKKSIIIVSIVLIIVLICFAFLIIRFKNKETSSNIKNNNEIIDNTTSIENDNSVSSDININDVDEKISLDGSKEYILLMDKVDNSLDKIDFSNKIKNKEYLYEDSFVEFELVDGGIKYTNIDGKSIVHKTNLSNIISIRLICNGNAGLCGELYYLTKDNILYKISAEEDLTGDKLTEEKIGENIISIATFDNPLAIDYTERILVTKNKDNKIVESEKIDFYNNISVYGGYSISPVYAISKDKDNLLSKYVSSKAEFIIDTKGNKIVGKRIKEVEDDENYKLIVETDNNELYEIEFK